MLSFRNMFERDRKRGEGRKKIKGKGVKEREVRGGLIQREEMRQDEMR